MCKQNLDEKNTFLDEFRLFRRNLDKMSYSAKCLLDEITFRRNRFRRNGMDPITCLQKWKKQVFSRRGRCIPLNLLQNGENQSGE